MLLWIPTTVVRSLNDIWIRVRTSLIRNSLWFEIESTYDSQMSESRFTYLWFLIRFDFDSQVNHDSRVNHDLRRMKIKPNKNESLRFVRIESESKWIKIKNKMIHLANQNLFVIFDKLRRFKNSRIKMNWFGQSPDLNFLGTLSFKLPKLQEKTPKKTIQTHGKENILNYLSFPFDIRFSAKLLVSSLTGLTSSTRPNAPTPIVVMSSSSSSVKFVLTGVYARSSSLGLWKAVSDFLPPSGSFQS